MMNEDTKKCLDFFTFTLTSRVFNILTVFSHIRHPAYRYSLKYCYNFLGGDVGLGNVLLPAHPVVKVLVLLASTANLALQKNKQRRLQGPDYQYFQCNHAFVAKSMAHK